jgi:hypothetical protein
VLSGPLEPGKLADQLPSGGLNLVHTPAGDGSAVPTARAALAAGLAVKAGFGLEVAFAGFPADGTAIFGVAVARCAAGEAELRAVGEAAGVVFEPLLE